MATAKAKANKTATAAASATTAGAAETTGAPTDALAQTDTGVTDGATTPDSVDADAAGPGGAGTAAGPVPTGHGQPVAGDDTAATGTGTVAPPGAGAAELPVGGDGVQAPAQGDTGGSAAAPFAPPTLTELVEQLREMPPERLNEARAIVELQAQALALFDLEQGVAQAAEVPVEQGPRRRAVVIYAAGVLHKVGDLVEGPEALLATLAKSGDVDQHPDAVVAAEARGAKVHQLGG